MDRLNALKAKEKNGGQEGYSSKSH